MNRLLTARELKARTRALKHSKPDISVFTDASIFNKTKSAGWGGWAKGDRRRTTILSGQAPFHTNTGLVELYAITAMIEELFETDYLWADDKSIIIQSDSTSALGYLLNSLQYTSASHLPESARLEPRLPPPQAFPLIERCHLYLQHFRIVYLRHVRAHQEDGNSRHGVNNICDVKAKSEAQKPPAPLPEWLKGRWVK